jgi:hypothetical protein
MQGRQLGHFSRGKPLVVVAIGSLVVLAALMGLWASVPRSGASESGLTYASSAVSISQFSFNPSNVNQGSQVSGAVDLLGGTPPYYLWFNDTPPGCSPSSNPVSINSPSYSFQCNPSSTGSYQVHLDVVDSSVPATKASQFASLNVNSNNNGNNNSNNGGNTSLSSLLPGGFLTFGIILLVVFLGAVVAIAAGVVALAILVPKRLRQLNETLAKSGLPPKEPKPPT